MAREFCGDAEANRDVCQCNIMPVDLINAHRDLWKYCRAQGLAGYDPYDGLNSRLFQATPFKNSRTARLAWIQFHKRSPFNFRSLAGVLPHRTPKPLLLIALAALADFVLRPPRELGMKRRDCMTDPIWWTPNGS